MATETCGWCERGKECLSEIGTCSSTFYYETGEDCPDELIEETVVIDNSDNKGLWESLKILRNEVIMKQFLIDSLSADKEKMLEDANNGLKITIDEVSIKSDLGNLVTDVDNLKTLEIKKSQDFETDLAKKTQKEVIDSTSKKLGSSKNKILDNLDEEYQIIDGDLSILGQDMSNSFDSINNLLGNITNITMVNAAALIAESNSD